MKLLSRNQRMMTKKTRISQHDKFVAAAKATSADEDETMFDAKLAKIGRGKPLSVKDIKKLVSERKKQK